MRIMAVEVSGESMLPALRPGDRLLVRRGGVPVPGCVVVARHPVKPETLIVKRVTHRDGDGWWLESDNQRASGRQDSWDFGAVPDDLVVGRAVLCYWPLSRISFSLAPAALRSPRAGSKVASALSRRRSRKAATVDRPAHRSEQ